MNNIYIFSGPIESNKTTRLMIWAAAQQNIDGIFQPVVDGKRFLYHVKSKNLKLLEIDKSYQQDEIITIGRFSFSKRVFEWAQETLLDSVKQNPDWLIIDEIGPLELDGKGLEPAVSKIMNYRDNFGGKILCVVRETMVKDFIEHYKLKDRFEIFTL